MAESKEEEQWHYGDDEDGEFAYVHYAEKGGRANEAEKLVEQQASDDGAVAGVAGVRVDAFRGHHCPICLGSVEDSAMIESCQHVYCKGCLFEV